MILLISAICVWVLGSAFGFGWSIGSLVEQGTQMSGSLHHAIWIAWPMYKLGYLCGQRYTARQLAPQRMKEKLKQAEQLKMWQQQGYTLQGGNVTVTLPNNPYWTTVTGTSTGNP